jgi:hypothetical protein
MSYKQYGRWTILEEREDKFFCKCFCGTEKLVNKKNLLDGRSKSCGCLTKEVNSKRRLNDLTGRTFGKWSVVKRIENDKWNMTKYLCRCECGEEKDVYAKHLNSGDSNGCHSCSVVSGQKHAQWKGCGDISGGWWSTHIGACDRQRNGNTTPVKITKEFAWELFQKQNKKCALSGLELVISNDHKKNTASIDRIDSAKGYTEENVQWVHKHINIMKNRFDQDYFIEMCKLISGACPIK